MVVRRHAGTRSTGRGFAYRATGLIAANIRSCHKQRWNTVIFYSNNTAAEGSEPPGHAAEVQRHGDLYSLLNAHRAASQAEIKAAFRKLARRYHPDVSVDPQAVYMFKVGRANPALKMRDKYLP